MAAADHLTADVFTPDKAVGPVLRTSDVIAGGELGATVQKIGEQVAKLEAAAPILGGASAWYGDAYVAGPSASGFYLVRYLAPDGDVLIYQARPKPTKVPEPDAPPPPADGDDLADAPPPTEEAPPPMEAPAPEAPPFPADAPIPGDAARLGKGERLEQDARELADLPPARAMPPPPAPTADDIPTLGLLPSEREAPAAPAPPAPSPADELATLEIERDKLVIAREIRDLEAAAPVPEAPAAEPYLRTHPEMSAMPEAERTPTEAPPVPAETPTPVDPLRTIPLVSERVAAAVGSTPEDADLAAVHADVMGLDPAPPAGDVDSDGAIGVPDLAGVRGFTGPASTSEAPTEAPPPAPAEAPAPAVTADSAAADIMAALDELPPERRALELAVLRAKLDAAPPPVL